MRRVEPKVFLVARTEPSYLGMSQYLEEVGGLDWLERVVRDTEAGPTSLVSALPAQQVLVEFGGRLCYRSWKPGLNKNVTKVRSDHAEYLRNILAQRHGSVLEHASYSFVFHNVSRVLTHELCRHRAGTAISQESMRYVRLTDIPFWVPEWMDDPEILEQVAIHLQAGERLQNLMARKFGLDEPGVLFSLKKKMTSFMRRFAPDGVATGILWTANVRTLRHVIEARTATGAEEEIRLVFGEVAGIMKAEAPALFGDFTEHEDGSWVPEWSKV